MKRSSTMITAELVVTDRHRLVIGVAGCLSELAEARRAVQSWLVGTPAYDRADDACLVAHELLANAVEHGSPETGSRVELLMEVFPDRGLLYIAVRDESKLHTGVKPGEARTTDESGRGLAIVSLLAQDWGFRADASGKSVWAALGI
ncbi:ATP-binding protein [Streptomyces bauhiniae]